MGNCGQNGRQRSGFYSMFSTLFGLKEKKGTLDKRGDQKPQTGLQYGKYMDIRGLAVGSTPFGAKVQI